MSEWRWREKGERKEGRQVEGWRSDGLSELKSANVSVEEGREGREVILMSE